MARPKKAPKAKEPVRVRFKKLANGNFSIYLDCYKDGQRSYEFLNLYIVPEVTPLDKVANANTMKVANTIKAQRIEAISTGKVVALQKTNKGNIALLAFMEEFTEAKRKEKRSEARLEFIGCAINHIKLFLNSIKRERIKVNEVDLELCEGFCRYLKDANDTRYKEKEVKLSNASVIGYFAVLNVALKWGVKHDYLEANPIDKMDGRVKANQEDKCFLSLDEVKAMADTQTQFEATKRAFLFSCFCGLRYSDVAALTWGNLMADGEGFVANITIRKTKAVQHSFPITKAAAVWMPERGDAKDGDKVFNLNTLANMDIQLKKWAKASGVTKSISFHTARHTFATLLLTLGEDLYTVSQLLGHRDIRMTQVYAKVIDSKKKEAVGKLNGII